MGKDLLPAIISSKLEFSKIIFCRNEPFTAQVDQDHLDMSSEQGFDVKVQQGLKDAFKELSNRSGDDGLFVVPSVKEAMDLVEPKSAVLVTGSLYLVAGMLTVLKQDI